MLFVFLAKRYLATNPKSLLTRFDPSDILHRNFGLQLFTQTRVFRWLLDSYLAMYLFAPTHATPCGNFVLQPFAQTRVTQLAVCFPLGISIQQCYSLLSLHPGGCLLFAELLGGSFCSQLFSSCEVSQLTVRFPVGIHSYLA